MPVGAGARVPACRNDRYVRSLFWARADDVAKRRRQGLVVCRATWPFEGPHDACPSVTLAPAFTAWAACQSRTVRVGDLGLAGELALGLADRVVGTPNAGGLGRAARRAGGRQSQLRSSSRGLLRVPAIALSRECLAVSRGRPCSCHLSPGGCRVMLQARDVLAAAWRVRRGRGPSPLPWFTGSWPVLSGAAALLVLASVD